MATPKQARTAGSSPRTGGNGAKARNKGTRGGRPDAQATAAARQQGGGRAGSGRAGSGNGQAGGGNAQARGGRNGQPGSAQRLGRRPEGQWAPGQRPAAVATDTTGQPGAPRWLQLATLVLSLGGLGISIYLTIAHFSSSAILACSDKGLVNCAAVTTSPESELFGIFPVAVLGLAFYVFLTAINTPWAWRAKWPVVGWARIGSLAAGMVFVLYLIYTELFTLGEICLWCTAVHVITFVLFGLVMFAAAAGYGIGGERAAR
jgi:uncharacterized membrane protein